MACCSYSFALGLSDAKAPVEAGAIAWRAQLDIYGVVREEEGVATEADRTANPWRFPAEHEDAETGLYYNRFRYYDPELGRYLSEDPIGLRGGVDLCGYAVDSVNSSDPFGLACKKAKELRSGKDVTVSSFAEADRVLFEAFPGARKVGGAGAKAPARVSRQKKAFKLGPGREAVYHKDYLHNPADAHGSLHGHESLPVGHPHKTVPHVNVLTPSGDKAVIFIVK